MTDDEKREMYGRCEKSELIEMIIARERADETILYGVDGGTIVTATIRNFEFDDGDPEIMSYVKEHFDELYEIE